MQPVRALMLEVSRIVERGDYFDGQAIRVTDLRESDYHIEVVLKSSTAHKIEIETNGPDNAVSAIFVDGKRISEYEYDYHLVIHEAAIKAREAMEHIHQQHLQTERDSAIYHERVAADAEDAQHQTELNALALDLEKRFDNSDRHQTTRELDRLTRDINHLLEL